MVYGVQFEICPIFTSSRAELVDLLCIQAKSINGCYRRRAPKKKKIATDGRWDTISCFDDGAKTVEIVYFLRSLSSLQKVTVGRSLDSEVGEKALMFPSSLAYVCAISSAPFSKSANSHLFLPKNHHPKCAIDHQFLNCFFLGVSFKKLVVCGPAPLTVKSSLEMCVSQKILASARKSITLLEKRQDDEARSLTKSLSFIFLLENEAQMTAVRIGSFGNDAQLLWLLAAPIRYASFFRGQANFTDWWSINHFFVRCKLRAPIGCFTILDQSGAN